jgi:hypothetical protein
VRTFFLPISVSIFLFWLVVVGSLGARYLLRCGVLLLDVVVVTGCPESSQGNAENPNNNNNNRRLVFLFLGFWWRA